jgi:hypothetical protein
VFAELLAGCATEDTASVAVLFADSAAEESASRISLLMASWLCGMSRYLLLEEKFCWLSELSFVGPFGTVSDVGSVDISPSQANIVTDVTIPSDVAIAFLAMDESFVPLSTFFFSIFKRELLSPIHSLKNTLF